MKEKEPILIAPDHLPPSMPSVPFEFKDDDPVESPENDKDSEEMISPDTLGLKSLKQILESREK